MVQTFVQSTDNVVDFLVGQHNLIKDMFDDVLHASGADARKQAFVELRQLLAVHETAEEMIVHPRARVVIEGGDIIVERRLHEELDAKEQLAALEQMDVESPEFLDAVTLLKAAVTDHADREETEEFNLLRRELNPVELKAMVAAVQAAEAVAPTRPHPGVESAALNLVVGPFASLLDRARDTISAVLK